MTKSKVVAITGASSGIGKATVQLFAQKGWLVYGGARHVERIPKGENIVGVHLDVTDSPSNKNFIETIMQKSQRLDVLINVAGYGETGPAEEISMEKAHQQFATNFFGAAELTKLALPLMRKQKSGRIVNISSIGGDTYSPLGAYYSASKAAMQQWSDTLDLEVSQFGIRSVVVQPGGTKSAWGATAMDNIQQNLHNDSAYAKFANLVGNALNDFSKGMQANAEDVAEVIYQASTDQKPKLRYFNTFQDHLAVIVARSFPRLYKRILLRTLKRWGKKA